MTTPDRGLIGPLIKAYAHAFFIHFATAYDFEIADTDARAELFAGVAHLEGVITATPMLTREAELQKEMVLQELREAPTDPTTGVKIVIEALATFGLVMDKELLGIADAALDPAGS